MKKPFLVSILGSLIAGLLICAHAVEEIASNQDAEAFIQDLGNDVIQILIDRKTKMAVRKERFRKEIEEHFDLKAIAKFVLARHWRTMAPEERETYLQLFENAVIENYASQFDNYNNEKLVIKSSHEPKDGGVLVKSYITRPGKGEPLHIHWKVFKTKRGLKVLDVIVENVSMSLSLRNEYSSVIQNRQGIPGLLDYLREKIAENQAKY